MLNRYSYQAALAAAESIHWRVEDIIGGDKRLNFTQPFMPESLAQAEPLTFLSKKRSAFLTRSKAMLISAYSDLWKNSFCHSY